MSPNQGLFAWPVSGREVLNSMFYTFTLLASLIGQAEKPQAPAALEQQIASSVADALETKGDAFKKLAVVVATDDRAAAKLDADQLVADLRELLEDIVVKHKRDVVDRAAFEAACQQLDVSGAPKPSDVARLRKQIELEAVVSATWSQRNERQTIRLALVAPDRVVWTKTLTAKLGDEIVATRKPKKNAQGNAQRAPVNGQQQPPVGPLDGDRIPGIIGSGGLIPNVAAGGGAVGANAGGGAVAGAAAEAGGAAKGKQVGSPDKAAAAPKGNAAAGGASKSTTASSSASNSSKSSTSNSTQASTTSNQTSAASSKSEGGNRAAATVPELNRKVLEFASNNLGRQVGNGECWTLAAEALAHANAQPPRGYTFGRELNAGETHVPGDIMQFTSCRFQSRNFTAIMGLPNHTAIVYAVDGDKTTFIHQNFGSHMVTLLTLDMTTRSSGNFTTYRPVSRDRE